MMEELEGWLAAQAARRARSRERHAELDGLSILVVDPDPRFRMLVARRLEIDGHHITEVSDGQSALDALRNGPWQMVWMRRALPDVSWEELAHEAREQVPGCFIAVLSEEAERREPTESPWADVVLPSPWKETELKEALAGATARA
jgi:CheY-like chemotaxis protein